MTLSELPYYAPERVAIRERAKRRMEDELAGITEFEDPTMLKPHAGKPRKRNPIGPLVVTDAVRKRAEEVSRLVHAKDAAPAPPERDMEEVARQVVDDFLLGVNRRQLNLRYRVPWTFINRAINEGTSHAERHEVWKAERRRQTQRDRDRHRVHQKKPAGQFGKRKHANAIGPYRSLRQAAEATGISATSARRLAREGVPVENWRETVDGGRMMQRAS